MLHSFECLWIAEETGHVDQKIVIKSAHFVWFPLQDAP